MQHTCELENKNEDFDTNSLQSSAALTCVGCLVLHGDESTKTVFRDQLVPCPQANNIKTSTWGTIRSPEHGVELIFYCPLTQDDGQSHRSR